MRLAAILVISVSLPLGAQRASTLPPARRGPPTVAGQVPSKSNLVNSTSVVDTADRTSPKPAPDHPSSGGDTRRPRDSDVGPFGYATPYLSESSVRTFLDPWPLSTARRDQLAAELTSLLNQSSIDANVITAAMVNAGIRNETAAVITPILVSRVLNGSRPAAASLLSNVIASGTNDRLNSTVDVFSYRDGRFAVHFTTSVAVSRADTGSVADTISKEMLESFRARTSNLLSALYEGGSVAANATYDIGCRCSETRGAALTLLGTVAKTGAVDSAGSAGFGASGELKLFSRQIARDDATSDQGIALTLRGGARYSNGGIVVGDTRHKTLWFGQAVVEGRSSAIKVPIGFALTWVNRAFRGYNVGFQLFGMSSF